MDADARQAREDDAAELRTHRVRPDERHPRQHDPLRVSDLVPAETRVRSNPSWRGHFGVKP